MLGEPQQDHDFVLLGRILVIAIALTRGFASLEALTDEVYKAC